MISCDDGVGISYSGLIWHADRKYVELNEVLPYSGLIWHADRKYVELDEVLGEHRPP